MTLAHKFREAVKSDDAPSRRESRLQNFPCVEPSALGLSTFSEGAARKRVRFNESLNVSFTRQRLCKLSERGEPLTALVSQNENGDAGTRDVQGDFVISRGPEVGASPADRQQDAVAMAEGSSQEGSQCSRRGGGGWQCPLPAHLDRALCLKHMQQMRFGGRISSKAAVRKTPKRTKTMTSNCLDVEGRAAASSEVTLDGNERATSLNDRRQRSQTSGRRFCSERRECSRGQQVDSVEVPMHGVEGDKEVVLQLEEVPRVGPESKNQKAEVLVDLEGLEEGAVGWQNGNLGGQQLAGAIEGTQLRRSVRLAKHRSPTARELLGITPRKVQDGSGCSPTKRRKVSIARDEPALNLTAPSAQVCKFAEVVCISDSSSDCLPLPSIDCVVGEWSAAEQDQREQDGATWKRMRLHGCAFYAALLEAVGGAAALQECEWGGILRHRWIGNKEEALLGIVPSRVGRGSHDQVQVAEGPYSWHSHAILGDSWPNLPSTADLLGVARESNLRPGGRGHVHLVVTPIGTWLLQATEELVQALYDGSTRSEAEAALEVQLQQIFDAHKCSVGYLPGVVPADAPDFWMDGHEAAIREALAKGDVEAQVRAYAEHLRRDAYYVVGFVGHGAADACFPLHCKPASRRWKQ